MMNGFIIFNKQQRNGVAVLLILIAVLAGYRIYIQIDNKRPKAINSSILKAEIDSMILISDSKKNGNILENNNNKREAIEFTSFDPNKGSISQWEFFGLSPKQIAIIQKYLQNGGKINKKEDFDKIYCLSDEQRRNLKLKIEFNTPQNASHETKKRELQSFNVNKSTTENWTQFGLSEKQSEIILKYLSHKRINNINEIKLIYILDEAKFTILSPYLIIEPDSVPTQMTQISTKEHIIKKPPTQAIDLNSTDSLELISLKGIGPYLASNIIRYRNRLGGYQSIDQLMEAGIKPQTIEEIQKYLKIDTEKVKKLSLNQSSLKDLMRHPYINYSLAKRICDYRNLNFKVKSLDELVKKEVVSALEAEKIRPYVK